MTQGNLFRAGQGERDPKGPKGWDASVTPKAPTACPVCDQVPVKALADLVNSTADHNSNHRSEYEGLYDTIMEVEQWLVEFMEARRSVDACSPSQ